MAAFFQSLGRTITAGIVIVIIMIAIGGTFGRMGSMDYWVFFMRWLHIMSGVMWIGLLWYFNFVQTPSMPKIPDEHKPAISKVIAPAALFWFRWAALSTLVTGLLLGGMFGWIGHALSLQRPYAGIGAGMWMGIIMAFNVWFVIWPNQKKVLGIVPAEAPAKAAAAKMAGAASRINTMLSIPMLYCMASFSHGGF
ncbi:MAG TPA: urate hydroxylase PuuD [Burkholderiales bacterium]|nr:urate hydroxylase PuuD [Burkholderiales bacterium]